MTVTFELDPDSVKQNKRAKYVSGHVDQSYIVRTHTRPITLPGPPKWSVNIPDS